MLFLFFLIIDLYFLIFAVIAQIFNPIAEFVIRIGISIKETKAEIKTHPIIVEITVSGQNNSKLYHFCMPLTH